jgi:isocitrate dehydrogenase
MSYEIIEVPEDGEPIDVVDAENNEFSVPDNPIVPIIHGDGIGQDISPPTTRVLDAAAKATGREIHWMRLYAGESARERYDENLPDETLDAFGTFHVGIKGPLATPVGAGHRSLNVTLRKQLDLYTNFRPTYYIEGIPSPVSEPEQMDMVAFRESTEDVYAGIEWEAGTDEAETVREFIEEEMGYDDAIHDGPSGIGVKPISEFGTKRLVRKAIDYALENNHESVTFVHKGNIMKYTEGAFRDWGYEVADDEYEDSDVVTQGTWDDDNDADEPPEDALLVNDRIADNMLQQILTQTEAYDVLVLPNLDGDYVTDAAGAQIGGLGVAPGANIGDGIMVAEPVHGTDPNDAGDNTANPTAMILSGRIMFEYMGWNDAADLIYDAIEATISEKKATVDIVSNLDGGEQLSTSEFADRVIESIETMN